MSAVFVVAGDETCTQADVHEGHIWPLGATVGWYCEGIEACGATAEACVCDLPTGHAEPHHCTRDGCGGQWTGTFDTDDFDVVRLPLEDQVPFGSLSAIMRFGSL